jgi:hypothetical protein
LPKTSTSKSTSNFFHPTTNTTTIAITKKMAAERKERSGLTVGLNKGHV